MKIGKKSKLILIVMMAVLGVIVLASCTVYDNFKATFIGEKNSNGEVLYIGVIEPQTGDHANVGKDEIKGIELANSIYNNVAGKDVKLTIVDTKSTTAGAKSAIQSLIKMDPVAIIGSAGEASSLVASEYIAKAKIPTITPSCVNPLITQDNGYYFRACITDNQMGAGLAEYAYSVVGSRNIGVIDIKNDNTVSAVINGFKDDIKSRAGDTNSILLNAQISLTDENALDKLLVEIKKKGVDTIFVPIGVEATENFFKKVEEQGMTDVTFLGTKAWATKDFAKICKKHPSIKVAFPSDNVIGENRSTNNAVTAETQRFMIEYANKYGVDETPSQYAALGYDSYLLIMNAINNAVNTGHENVRNALASTSGVQCSTGVFRFDARGNTIRSVNIASVQDGKIVTVYTTMDTSSASEIKELEE